MMNSFSTKIYYYVQKTLQKYLLQYIAICNRISANLLHIAICNKWYLIALHIYCNRPVIYWKRSDCNTFLKYFMKYFLKLFSKTYKLHFNIIKHQKSVKDLPLYIKKRQVNKYQSQNQSASEIIKPFTTLYFRE